MTKRLIQKQRCRKKIAVNLSSLRADLWLNEKKTVWATHFLNVLMNLFMKFHQFIILSYLTQIDLLLFTNIFSRESQKTWHPRISRISKNLDNRPIINFPEHPSLVENIGNFQQQEDYVTHVSPKLANVWYILIQYCPPNSQSHLLWPLDGHSETSTAAVGIKCKYCPLFCKKCDESLNTAQIF